MSCSIALDPTARTHQTAPRFTVVESQAHRPPDKSPPPVSQAFSASWSVVLGLVFVSVLLGGCANMANRSSGFLNDYGQLKPDPKDSHRLVYERAEWKKTDYTSVLIEPVAVRLTAKDQEKVSAKEMTDLAAFSDLVLRKTLAKEWKIVTAAEPGTLRVRAAITGLDTSDPALNVVTSLVLGPVDNGGVCMEFDVSDATNGERLVALVGYSNGTPLQSLAYFSRLGHAHYGINHWCVELRKIAHSAAKKIALAGHPAQTTPGFVSPDPS